MARILTHTFATAATDAWPDADTGQTWTLLGTATEYDAAGGKGTVRHGTANSTRAETPSLAVQRDVEITAEVSLDKVPAGGQAQFLILGRSAADASARYQLRVDWNPEAGAGAVPLAWQLGKVLTPAGGAATLTRIGVVQSTSFNNTAAQSVSIKFYLSGASPTTIRGKVWQTGGTEPAYYDPGGDSEPTLQDAGLVSFRSFVSSTATNVPLTFSVDNIAADTVGANPQGTGLIGESGDGRVHLTDPLQEWNLLVANKLANATEAQNYGKTGSATDTTQPPVMRLITNNPENNKVNPWNDEIKAGAVAAGTALLQLIYRKGGFNDEELSEYVGTPSAANGQNPWPEDWFCHTVGKASPSYGRATRLVSPINANVWIMQPDSSAPWTDKLGVTGNGQNGAANNINRVYRGWEDFQIEWWLYCIWRENNRSGIAPGSNPINGVWGDTLGRQTINGQVNPATGVEYTATQWFNILNAHLARKKLGIAPNIFWANGIAGNPGLADPAVSVGVMFEGWLRDPTIPGGPTSYPDDPGWLIDMRKVMNAQIDGAFVQAYAKWWNTTITVAQLEAWHRYAVCSYFLADMGKCYLGITNGQNKAPWYENNGPSVQVNMGPPQESELTPEGYRLKAGGTGTAAGWVYSRIYNTGRVLLNTADVAISVTLDRAYTADLDGPNAALTAGATLTVPANSGVILTGAGAAVNRPVNTVLPAISNAAGGGTPTTYYEDTFTRTTSSGWGTASPTGTTYTLTGTAADYATTGTVATISNSAVNAGRIATQLVSQTDVELTGSLVFPTSPSVADLQAGIGARGDTASSPQNYYRINIVYDQGTGNILALPQKVVANTPAAILGASNKTITYTAGQTLSWRIRLDGTTLTFRIWNSTTGSEPGTPDWTGTDASITTGGYVVVRSFRSTGNTNTGVITQWDNLKAVSTTGVGSDPTPDAGETWTTTNGTWTNTPTSYSYQWQRNPGSGFVNISGALAQTYTVQPADAGSTLRSRVTAANATGSANIASTASDTVAGVTSPPVNVTSPVLSGGTGSVLQPPPLGVYRPGATSIQANYMTAVSGITVYVDWAELQSTDTNSLSGVGVTRIDNAVNYCKLNNKQLKIRLFCGADVPAWLKTLAGSFQYADSQDKDVNNNFIVTTMARFWTPLYTNRYARLMTLMAARWDKEPVVRDITIANSMTRYAEPFRRSFNVPENRAEFVGGGVGWAGTTIATPGAGYTDALNMQTFRDGIDAHGAWQQTRSSLAYNPYETLTSYTVWDPNDDVELTKTRSVMDYHRKSLGNRAVLANHSVRSAWFTFDAAGNATGFSTAPNLAAMTRLYQHFLELGPPLFYQTAHNTPGSNLIGDMSLTAEAIINLLDGNAMEPPGNYATLAATDPDYDVAAMAGYDAALRANSYPTDPAVLQGDTLTVTAGTWNGTPAPSFTYQWYRANPDLTGQTPISGATASTYDAVSGDVGKRLVAKVTALNSSGSAVASSNASPLVSTTPGAPANTVAPVASGTPREGQTLTTGIGTWTGSPAPTFSYQWQRAQTGTGVYEDIVDAVLSTYTLVQADVGMDVRAEVIAANASGGSSAFSNAIGPVADAAPTITAPPAITAPSWESGQTVTATTGTWTSATTPTYAYQWLRANPDFTGEAAVGANSATYALVAGDVGKRLRVQVTADNGLGVGSAFSGYGPTVTAATAAPVNTALPVITGTPTYGATLRTSTGAWTGEPAPTFTYQWQTSPDGTTWTNTNLSLGAAGTSTAFQIAAVGAVGLRFRVQVTATNSAGSATASSAATSAATNLLPPQNRAAPKWTGTPTVGEALTPSIGVWDFLESGFLYWQRADPTALTWADITTSEPTRQNVAFGTGAASDGRPLASNPVVLVASDEGKLLRIRHEASNTNGVANSYSTATPVITRQPVAPPANEGQPVVFGTPTEDQTLTTNNGTWANNPDTYTYQWERGTGDPVITWRTITGATSSTLLLTNLDVGALIRSVVTATNEGGTKSQAADPVGPIEPLTEAPAPLPPVEIRQFQYVLANRAGDTISSLEQGTSRELQVNVEGEPTSASISIPLDSTAAYAVEVGWSRLKVYLDGTLRFHGKVWEVERDLEADQMTLVAFDPLAQLDQDHVDSRALLPIRYKPSENATARTITVDLVGRHNRYATSDQGAELRMGSSFGQYTYKRRKFEGQESILSALQTLMESGDPVEFYCRPVEGTTKPLEYPGGGTFEMVETIARLDLYQPRKGGTAPNALFAYGTGPDNIQSARHEESASAIRNRAVALGAQIGPKTRKAIADAQESRGRYGNFEAAESYGDIREAEHLAEKAESLLHPNPETTITITPGPNAPKLWEDYDLGDEVPVIIRRGAFNIETVLRVTRATLTIDDQGYETASEITASTGNPGKWRRDFTSLLRRTAKRITRLENQTPETLVIDDENGVVRLYIGRDADTDEYVIRRRAADGTLLGEL